MIGPTVDTKYKYIPRECAYCITEHEDYKYLRILFKKFTKKNLVRSISWNYFEPDIAQYLICRRLQTGLISHL